jgi:hypothetical protein
MGTFNFKDQQDFNDVKKKAETFYASVRSVRTPYFGGDVVFNAKGIRHLKLKLSLATARQELYLN